MALVFDSQRVSGNAVFAGQVYEASSDQLITANNSTQANSAFSASIAQTHLLGIASASQANTASPGAITQAAVTSLITAANSTQSNTASTSAVRQTHLVTAANAVQANTVTPGSVSLDNTVFISAANSTQANTASTASISQTHLIVGAAVSVDSIASASAIVQAHLIGAANAVQGNVATAGSVGTGLAYWPAPNQVLAGVAYGPTGADYLGTATAGVYPSAADIATAVVVRFLAMTN